MVKTPIRPTTQARAKRFHDSMQAFVCAVYEQFGVSKSIEGIAMEGGSVCTLIQVEEITQNEVDIKLGSEQWQPHP